LKQSDSRGWLKFKATVEEAEQLFHAKYHIYEHSDTGQQHAACEEYSIPTFLKNKIDIVIPSVHFDVKLRARNTRTLQNRERTPGNNIARPGADHGGPKLKDYVPHEGIIKQLQDCDKQITPWCLRMLYKFPPGRTANSNNSYGIVEYTPQAYVLKKLVAAQL
jgi:tripeptidyl-peptidase-1